MCCCCRLANPTLSSKTPAEQSAVEFNPALFADPATAHKMPQVNMGSSIVTAMPVMVNQVSMWCCMRCCMRCCCDLLQQIAAGQHGQLHRNHHACDGQPGTLAVLLCLAVSCVRQHLCICQLVTNSCCGAAARAVLFCSEHAHKKGIGQSRLACCSCAEPISSNTLLSLISLLQHCCFLSLSQGGAMDTVSKGETVVRVPGSTETKHLSGLDSSANPEELAAKLRDTVVSGTHLCFC